MAGIIDQLITTVSDSGWHTALDIWMGNHSVIIQTVLILFILGGGK